MLNAVAVLERFAGLAGISGQEAERYLPLAQSCVSSLNRQINWKQALPEDLPALELAAAGVLLYQYGLLGQGQGAEEFQLGDLSLSLSQSGSDLSGLRALRDELLGAVAHLIPRGLSFLMQVRAP